MKFRWIVPLDKNYAILLDIASVGTRETVFVDGKLVVDKNVSSMFHTHSFKINDVDCKIKMFGLNNMMPIFIKLYIGGNLVKRYKSSDPTPSDIDPKWLDMKPCQLFQPTPAWYWLFVVANAIPVFLIEAGKIFQMFPAFIAVLVIIHMARSNPKRYTIKQRLSFFVGMSIANLALTLFLHNF